MSISHSLSALLKTWAAAYGVISQLMLEGMNASESALDVEALRSSFSLVVTNDPNVIAKLYDLLFQRMPEARALFHGFFNCYP